MFGQLNEDFNGENNKFYTDLGYYLSTLLMSSIGYVPKYGEGYYDYVDWNKIDWFDW